MLGRGGCRGVGWKGTPQGFRAYCHCTLEAWRPGKFGAGGQATARFCIGTLHRGWGFR
jgi:hypothetical protein